MDQNDILIPLMALIGWTMLVLLLVPYQRIKAARKGQVTTQDFKLGESGKVPEATRIPNRNFMNLLEVPVLFYIVCLVLCLTQKGDALALQLAWAYVALRVLHSLIHLSYNRVMHRLTAFALSNGVLVVIWARLLLSLLQ